MKKDTPKRKAFNFYLSYFDVYNEIDNDSDKLAFLDALLKRQFLGIEPTDLKGLSKFGYNSQKEIINKQIKGWETKTGVSLSNPTLAKGGDEPLNNPPTQQEQEEGKEQEQGKVEEEVEEKEVLNIDIDLIRPIKELKEIYLNNKDVVKAVLSNKNNFFIDRHHLTKRIDNFNDMLTENGRLAESYKEYSKYFLSWHKKTRNSSSNNESNFIIN